MTRNSFDGSSTPAPVSHQELQSAVEKLNAEVTNLAKVIENGLAELDKDIEKALQTMKQRMENLSLQMDKKTVENAETQRPSTQSLGLLAKVQEPIAAQHIQKSSLSNRGPQARPAERGKHWMVVGYANDKRRQENVKRAAKDGANAVLMPLIDTHTCLDIEPFPATREDFWSIDESETMRLAKALDITTEGRPMGRIMHDLFETIIGPLPSR
ncbi:hypothetical protein HER10_EVM0005145 [Colletotrichum scovillei]|uniref:uncharacterized protein n=1 Tax=Colletotrichum scovillei TaxID=1209932 RepID=UPI0015C30951|nr:uncharacterized protein HER10_EVM0005145 [Colletotrichum scovillei]KAF4773170.1 hypothetical protein HER10_EVM0005145 [Colletotrichum scovillei]